MWKVNDNQRSKFECKISTIIFRELQKTEILWEDSWQDFLDTLLEFSMQWLEGPLTKVSIDPVAHMKTVKDGANLLLWLNRVLVIQVCTMRQISHLMF